MLENMVNLKDISNQISTHAVILKCSFTDIYCPTWYTARFTFLPRTWIFILLQCHAETASFLLTEGNECPFGKQSFDPDVKHLLTLKEELKRGSSKAVK